MFNHVEIDGFGGINLSFDLKRVNIIVTEGNVNKTFLLETIFTPLLILSQFEDDHVIAWFKHMVKNKGDLTSFFSTFDGGEVKLDKDKAEMGLSLSGNIVIHVNEYTEIELEPDNFLVTIDPARERKYKPVYISTYFNQYPIPEIIYTSSGGKTNTNLRILYSPRGKYRLHYKDKPVYVIDRGILKSELIKLALAFSDILLIDEVESSLHPTMLNDILKAIKDSKNTQVIMTTFSNKVIKTFYDTSDAQVIFVNGKGYKVYTMEEIKDYENPINMLGYV